MHGKIMYFQRSAKERTAEVQYSSSATSKIVHVQYFLRTQHAWGLLHKTYRDTQRMLYVSTYSVRFVLLGKSANTSKRWNVQKWRRVFGEYGMELVFLPKLGECRRYFDLKTSNHFWTVYIIHVCAFVFYKKPLAGVL